MPICIGLIRQWPTIYITKTLSEDWLGPLVVGRDGRIPSVRGLTTIGTWSDFRLGRCLPRQQFPQVGLTQIVGDCVKVKYPMF